MVSSKNLLHIDTPESAVPFAKFLIGKHLLDNCLWLTEGVSGKNWGLQRAQKYWVKVASGSLRAERLSSRVVGIRVKFKKKLYVYDYGINVLNKNVFPQGQVLFWRLNYVGKPIGPLWQWKNPHSKPIVLSTRFLVWFHILTCEKSFVY